MKVRCTKCDFNEVDMLPEETLSDIETHNDENFNECDGVLYEYEDDEE